MDGRGGGGWCGVDGGGRGWTEVVVWMEVVWMEVVWMEGVDGGGVGVGGWKCGCHVECGVGGVDGEGGMEVEGCGWVDAHVI